MARPTKAKTKPAIDRELEAYVVSTLAADLLERERKEAEALDGITSETEADPTDPDPTAELKPKRKRKARK